MHKPDYLLLGTIIFLIIFGLVVLTSTSIVISQKKFGESFYFLKHQILNGLLPGLIIFLIISHLNYSFLKRYAMIIIIITVILMILVPLIGTSYKGAQRWLALGGFSFQPSELLKISLIIYLASWIESRKKDINSLNSVATILLIMLVPAIFLILQPDMSTLAIIILISMIMYFYSSAKISYFALGGLVIAFLLVAVTLVAPYRLKRITSFLNPEIGAQGLNYQINQSLVAIGSGGFWGRGYGQSIQKFNFLPEPVGDSIFAVLAEEFGFLGITLTILAFFIILKNGLAVANQAPDFFSQSLAIGLTSYIVVQAFINILSISGLIPLMGIPLPFFSYGGSHFISNLATCGILINISKYTKNKI
ncbi:MAG: putative lipid II flippase FtsW [Candidatus Staskawiczbacteria bacterium]|nr:putative lipid II flippase FtsW [Candidatus Staskawiczbacteria bacterium]